MKNTFYLTLVLFFIHLNSNAQVVSIADNNLKYDHGFSAEVFNQGAYGFGIGGIIGKNLGDKTKPNYSMGIYTDIILGDAPIISPRIKFILNHSGIAGIGINFANNYRAGENDFRVTPELNLSLFGIVNLFFGYSFNVNANSFKELTEYRIGVNINFIGNNKR